MRFLVFILLLVSIAATVVPCCSFDGCSEELATATHPEKKEQKGTCSPLSICASCSVAAIQTKNPVIAVPEIARCGFAEAPANNHLPSYSASFWQPPRTTGSIA